MTALYLGGAISVRCINVGIYIIEAQREGIENEKWKSEVERL